MASAFNASGALPYGLPSSFAEAQVSLANAGMTWWAAALVAAAAIFPLIIAVVKKPDFPTVNYEGWELTYANAKKKYVADARGLLATGFQKFRGGFYMVTDYGPKLILPPEYIDLINQEPKLDLMAWSGKEQLAHLPGFEVFGGIGVPGLLEDAVRIKLTQNLPKFTDTLNFNMAALLDRSWVPDGEWHTSHVYGDILGWVARLSAVVFVPEELASDPEWLKLSAMFTVDLFTANKKVRSWPPPLRRLACYILPECRKLRQEYEDAKRMIRPVTDKRAAQFKKAEAAGIPPPKYNDAIEWAREMSKGRPYSAERAQLGLTMAAIHTTSDLLSQCLYNLCEHPEVVQPLRDEAIQVIGQEGFTKVSMYKLEMLDSFMKETQRLKPPGILTLNRGALSDVELPGGVKVKKGDLVGVSSHLMWDAEEYPQPQRFDPFRFVKRRKDAAKASSSHFVSTATNFTAFGHGKHACPGRFFAANEVKIALVHILMKYDIKMDRKAIVIEHGATMMCDPTAVIHYKRRKEEFEVAGRPGGA